MLVSSELCVKFHSISFTAVFNVIKCLLMRLRQYSVMMMPPIFIWEHS